MRTFSPAQSWELAALVQGLGWEKRLRFYEAQLAGAGYEELKTLATGVERAAKVSKESVNYRAASKPGERCGTCVMWRDGLCTLVAGPVEANHVCDRWSPVTARKVGPKGYIHGWVYVGAPKTDLGQWKGREKELLDLHRATKDDDRRDKVLERIAHYQGFDAHPSEGELDPGRETWHRGFGDRFGGHESDYADQFKHGEYYGSTGLRANGIFTSTKPDVAEGYGQVLHMQPHLEAKIASVQDLESQLDKLPEPWKEIVSGDPGRLAALLGYDAVTTGGYHRIILNRGAVRVGDTPANADPSMSGAGKRWGGAWLNEARDPRGRWVKIGHGEFRFAGEAGSREHTDFLRSRARGGYFVGDETRVEVNSAASALDRQSWHEAARHLHAALDKAREEDRSNSPFLRSLQEHAEALDEVARTRPDAAATAQMEAEIAHPPKPEEGLGRYARTDYSREDKKTIDALGWLQSDNRLAYRQDLKRQIADARWDVSQGHWHTAAEKLQAARDAVAAIEPGGDLKFEVKEFNSYLQAIDKQITYLRQAASERYDPDYAAALERQTQGLDPLNSLPDAGKSTLPKAEIEALDAWYDRFVKTLGVSKVGPHGYIHGWIKVDENGKSHLPCRHCGKALKYNVPGRRWMHMHNDSEACALASGPKAEVDPGHIRELAETHNNMDDLLNSGFTGSDAEGVVNEASKLAGAGTRLWKKKGGSAETLREYWTHEAHGGPTHFAGAKEIAWGTPGDFMRCVALVKEHAGMSDEHAKGYCNLLHHRALGYWPATHARMEGKAVGGDGGPKVPELVKVGPEGYIHGWICVRPPCGPGTGVKLEPRGNGYGSQPGYTVTQEGSGAVVGYLNPYHPVGGGPNTGKYTGHAGFGQLTGFHGDPHEAAKELSVYHNLKTLSGAAESLSLEDARRAFAFAAVDFKYGRGDRSEEDRVKETARMLQRGAEALARGSYDTKATPRVLAMDQAARDLYHHVTGEEMPGEPLRAAAPDEPWAKVGKIRKSNLEVRGAGPAQPGFVNVYHKPSGTLVGTIRQEWLSKSHPHSPEIWGDSKAYYTGRLANGDVAYFGVSTARKSGHENALEWIIDAHNKAIQPRIQRPPEPPVPVPLPEPPDWFKYPRVDLDGVPEGQKAEVQRAVTAQLTLQARYVPNVVARAELRVGRLSARSAQSSILGQHWTGTGKIEIKPDVFESVNPGSERTLAESQKSHWWVPADEEYKQADTVVAHEVGHGVADRGMGSKRNTNPAMWKAIANAIGVLPLYQHENKATYEQERALNRWIGQNKAKIAREVSTYATTNMDELLAELWQEYTLASAPRPPAKAYGDYVMRHMPNRLTEPGKEENT